MKVRNTTMDNETPAMTTATTQTAAVLKQSPVWNYFERINTNGSLKAKCLINGCTQVLATPLYSTSTLMRHLRDVHKLTDIKSKEKFINRSNTKKISFQLKKKLDQAALVAIVEDGRSFNDFSKKGIKKFIQLALPNYKPPHRNIIAKQLKRLHTKHLVSMVDTLSKLSFISISTDFWSDAKGISYLVLTGHYITNELDLNSTILRFSSFQQRHFSDLIGLEIEKQLIELKLFDKVVSITCDAAPNMVKMFDHLSRSDINRIRCQAHLLHLIICNGLGVWVEKKKKKNTTDESTLIDPDERLSQSLRKVNIIDIAESNVEEGDYESNGQDIESRDENEEDANVPPDDIADRYDDETNANDNDDWKSISTDCDSENEFEVYEDNFQVGIRTALNENFDQSSARPDPRIGLVIEKTRQLVGMIKDSSILSSFVKQLKHEYNKHSDDKIKRSLILDVRTRWNSTYKMLQTLNMHRVIINELFQNKTNIDITKKQQQRLNSLEFTSDCWYTIELLIKVLKPFYAATKAISGSDYPSIGIALFIFRRLDKDFLSVDMPTDDPLLINMKACLLNKMIYYNTVQDPSQTKTIMFYGYFDPYGMSVLTNNEINTVENEIKYIIRHQTSNSPTQASTASSSSSISSAHGSSTTENNHKKSLINYFLDTLNSEDNKETKKQSSTLNQILNEEFKMYKKLVGQYVSTLFDSYDPLMFWKQNKVLLPNLTTLAQKYLASPGTSIKSESAFSISAYYGRKQRSQLSSENLCFSVFLKDKVSNQDN